MALPIHKFFMYFNNLRSGSRKALLISAVATGVGAALPAAAAEPVVNALTTCWSCHGQNARPKDASIPVIQGQRADYLADQMSAFARGERANAKTMSAQMKALSAVEQGLIAKFLAGQ